jgi:hypothetical protein
MAVNVTAHYVQLKSMLKTACKNIEYCCWATHGSCICWLPHRRANCAIRIQNVFHKATLFNSPATRRAIFWLKSLHTLGVVKFPIPSFACVRLTENSSNTRSGTALYHISAVQECLGSLYGMIRQTNLFD